MVFLCLSSSYAHFACGSDCHWWTTNKRVLNSINQKPTYALRENISMYLMPSQIVFRFSFFFFGHRLVQKYVWYSWDWVCPRECLVWLWSHHDVHETELRDFTSKCVWFFHNHCRLFYCVWCCCCSSDGLVFRHSVYWYLVVRSQPHDVAAHEYLFPSQIVFEYQCVHDGVCGQPSLVQRAHRCESPMTSIFGRILYGLHIPKKDLHKLIRESPRELESNEYLINASMSNDSCYGKIDVCPIQHIMGSSNRTGF